MAPNPSSGTGACKLCGRPQDDARRQYLHLQSLCLHELPPHPNISRHNANQEPSLATFLKSVLTEAYEVDFDDHTWTHHGKYPPKGSRITVQMQASKPTSRVAPAKDISVEVDKRVKGNTSSAFLARRSYHHVQEVDYPDLDTILSQDHCRKEAEYDPSIFDGNELLKWDAVDLQRAVEGLKPEWMVRSVQMSIFQMFHEMPKVLGMSLLQDRVFHVLCMTAHSTYLLPGEDESWQHLQSHTIQLPVNIDSCRDLQSIMLKSRFRPQSKIYEIKDSTPTQPGITRRQEEHIGKSVTEGIYVSLERLCQAPGGPEATDNEHRWDMMTRSDARGITRFAPWSIKRKETLDAIAKDVQYVLEHIKKEREAKRSPGETEP